MPEQQFSSSVAERAGTWRSTRAAQWRFPRTARRVDKFSNTLCRPL